MRTPLVSLTCSGCGACCLHESSPPGYAWKAFRQAANLPPALEAELVACAFARKKE